MENKIYTEQTPATPLSAFSEAVSVAYAANINEYIVENPPKRPRFFVRNALDKFLKEASNGTCERSSIDAAYVMATRSPNVYKKIFLMTSYDLPQSSNVSKMIVGRNGVLFYHTYVVMQGTDDQWYAASPGNHNSKKQDSYALNIIKESSLEKVINYIKKRDGGNWPEPSSAESLLLGSEYQSPTFDRADRSITVFNIEQGNGHQKFMYTYKTRVSDN